MVHISRHGSPTSSFENIEDPELQRHPFDPSTPTNGTGSTNGTTPGDDGPWVPTCKLPYLQWLSVGHGFSADCVQSRGTIQGRMIFVDFPDGEALEGESPQDAYDLLVPDANKLFLEISYGQLDLNITADTSKFYRMPNTAESYNWDAGLSQYDYVLDVLDAYTNNGENPPPPVTDILYVVPTRNVQWMTRSLASGFGAFTRNGTFVAKRAITFGVDPYIFWGFKALNHETGHAMCLPDLYPLDINLPAGEFVGGYSIMGNIGGIASDLFAWVKWRLGWFADEDVDCILEHGTTRHTLTPLETQGGTKAVVVAANSTSALVAEARVALGADKNICAPGVLLYTIDTSRPSGMGPIRVLDAMPEMDSCGSAFGGWEGMNDATLSLSATRSYEVAGWGIKVTLMDDKRDEFEIEVEYSWNNNNPLFLMLDVRRHLCLSMSL